MSNGAVNQPDLLSLIEKARVEDESNELRRFIAEERGTKTRGELLRESLKPSPLAKAGAVAAPAVRPGARNIDILTQKLGLQRPQPSPLDIRGRREFEEGLDVALEGIVDVPRDFVPQGKIQEELKTFVDKTRILRILEFTQTPEIKARAVANFRAHAIEQYKRVGIEEHLARNPGALEKALVGKEDSEETQVLQMIAEQANIVESTVGQLAAMPFLLAEPETYVIGAIVPIALRPLFNSPAYKGLMAALTRLIGPRGTTIVASSLGSGAGVGTFTGLGVVAHGPLEGESGGEFALRVAKSVGQGALFGGIIFGIPFGVFRAGTMRVRTPTQAAQAVLDLAPEVRRYLLRTASEGELLAAIRRGEKIKDPNVRKAYEEELRVILQERKVTPEELTKKAGTLETTRDPFVESERLRKAEESPLERDLRPEEVREIAREVNEGTEGPERVVRDVERVREEAADVPSIFRELSDRYSPAEIEAGFVIWSKGRERGMLASEVGPAAAARIITRENFARALLVKRADAVNAVRRAIRAREGFKPVRTLRQLREQLRGLRGEKVSEGIRNEALRLIKENVPFNSQQALLTSVVRAKTFPSLRRAISHAIRVIRRTERKAAVKDFTKSLAKAKRENLRPEFKKIPDAIEAEFDVKGMTERTRRALVSTAKFLEAQTDTSVIPLRTIERLNRLNKTNFKELTTNEIRELTDAINLARHLNRTKNRLLGLGKTRSIDNLSNQISSEVSTRVAELRARQTLVDRLQGRPISKARRSLVGQFFLEFATRPEVILEHISPTLQRLVYNDIAVLGFNREHAVKWRQRDLFATLAESLGKPILTADFTRWRNETVSVQGVEFTRAEATWLRTSMLDASNARLIRRNGVTIERTGETHKFKGLTIEELNKAIGHEAEMLSNHMFEQFNTSLKSDLNSVWLEVYGFEVANVIDYVPRRIDMNMLKTGESPIEQLASMYEATLTSAGFLRERVGTKGPLKIDDAYDVYFRHVDHVARIHAYLEPVANAHSILGRVEVKKMIKSRIGDVGYNRIVGAINQQVLRNFPKNAAEQIFRKRVKFAGASILSLRVSTLMLNPSGLTVSAAYIPNGFSILARSVPSGFNPAELSRLNRFLVENSPYYRSRYEDFGHQLLSGMTNERVGLGKKPVAEMGLVPLILSDKFGALIRARMAEIHVRENLKIEPTDPRYKSTVAREWEQLMFRGENTGHGMELTGALAYGREQAFFAPAVMFSSSVSKIYSVGMRGGLAASRGVRAARAGDLTAARAELALATRSFAGFAGAIVWAGMVREILRSARGSVDEPLSQRAAQRLITEMSAGIPILGQNVIAPIASRVISGTGGPRYSASLTDDVIQDMYGTLASTVSFAEALITQELAADGELVALQKLSKAFEGGLNLTALYFGLPFQGPQDLGRIGKNLFLGENLDERQVIRKALKRISDDGDLSQPRRRVLQSARLSNDRMFRRGVLGLPEEKRTRRELRRIIISRYAGLLNIGRRLELDEIELNAVEVMRLEHDAYLREIDELIRRNRDVMRGSGR